MSIQRDFSRKKGTASSDIEREMNEVSPKIILGIDPGTNFTGYGIITISGKQIQCEAIGYIDMVKMADTYQKLRHIFERVSGIIDSYHPDEVAFESPFYGENVQSMLKLGRAQGVAMAAALTKGLPVFEYAPRKVKAAITGNGAASKEQVASLLCSQLKIKQAPTNLDSTDGLAVAMCHYYEMTSIKAVGGGVKSWKEFAVKNSKRIKK